MKRATVAQTRFASGGSSYNQPTGYLFGEKVSSQLHRTNLKFLNSIRHGSLPRGNRAFASVTDPLTPSFHCGVSSIQVAKGQKRQKEDWENMYYFGLFGGMAFAGLVLMYKPDTRYVALPRIAATIPRLRTLAVLTR